MPRPDRRTVLAGLAATLALLYGSAIETVRDADGRLAFLPR
ncbi:hypothetical protein [Bosea sp. (in: a-proteobacteria)]